MNDNLLQIGSAALKKAALNEDVKNFVLTNKKLFETLKKAANRYIGGETLEEAVLSIRRLNDKGYSVTTDFMGESIRDEQEANAATAEFVRLAKAISTENISSSISLDLSHIGLLISKDLTVHNLELICREAAKARQEVIISMEGVDRTDPILDIYRQVVKAFPNLGITVQAYLHRTKDDLPDLMQYAGSIRLVKGAYDVPGHLALERGNLLDETYLQYAEQLLAKDHPCSIASHHEKIHQETIKLIDRYKPTNYVLERLLGICNEELETYRTSSYHCRIYVVYGREWYLYLCNRWAEYPLNLFRGLADIIEP